MIRPLACCVALALPATAQADQFCQALSPQDNLPVLILPNSDQAATCTKSIVLGAGVQINCSWSFAYRDMAATQAFEDVFGAVATCLGPDVTITQDQSVNHPDFYDLRTLQHGSQEVAVSLKDKGALSQTLVFVRISDP